MLIPILTLAESEFGDEIPNIAELEKAFNDQAFEAIRKLEISEKIMPKKTVEINIRNYRHAVPDDYYGFVDTEDGGFCVYKSLYGTSSNPWCEVQEGGMIVTSERECTIDFTYWAIPTDERGMCLVTEEFQCDLAVKAFLRHKHTRARFLAGEVAEGRYEAMKREWEVQQGLTKGKGKMPTPGQYMRVVRVYKMGGR